MEKLNFSININAQREKVWEIMWNETTYNKWISVFSEGSYAESDWEEGSAILFLTPSGEGMRSVIETKDPPQKMTFRHIAMIKDGKDIELEDPSKSWNGFKENYMLNEIGSGTMLEVEIDTTEDYVDYFNKTYPVAFELVRQMSEG